MNTQENPAQRSTASQSVAPTQGEAGGAVLERNQVRGSSLEPLPARGQYTEKARLERLEYLRSHTGAPLQPLQHTTLRAENLTSNVESLVGAVEVPVGVAGPLLFRGDKAQGSLFLPVATTEGALVASITRGATALTRSGGVVTRVLQQRMIRAPFFEFAGLEAAWRFCQILADSLAPLREQIRRVSRHATLLELDPLMLGRGVHVRFIYETRDASGQNMTTSCTWAACQWLLERARLLNLEPLYFSVEGNTSGDKKFSWLSFLSGRGTRVVAEALLPRQVMEQVLKTTPEALLECYNAGLSGAIQSGTVGSSVNASNVVAGVFIATGQDVACVHESGAAYFTLRPDPEGLYASIVLPSLVIGTVGGGTHLPHQRALLEMMGCAQEGGSARLAEIIAGFALALDLSTASALASGQFVAAHERLGRNRPVNFLRREDFTPEFFRPAVRKALGDEQAEPLGVEPLVSWSQGSAVLSELAAHQAKRSKWVGHLPLRLSYRTGQGVPGSLKVMVKSKALDEEVLLAMNTVASLGGERLASAFNRHGRRLGFGGSHVRELAVNAQRDERFVRHAPTVYQLFTDERREAWLLVTELLEGLVLMDSSENPDAWGTEHLTAALRGIAEVHSIWYGRQEELLTEPWLGYVWTAQGMAEAYELWEALLRQAANELPEWFPREEVARHERLLETLPQWWGQLESMPRTLIHNDFNTRNIALRPTPSGFRLCAWDWELATVHLPQHDLAELLAFALPPDVTREQVTPLLEVHRRALEEASGQPIDAQAWRAGYTLCLKDLLVNRMSLYLQRHIHQHLGFVERTLHTLRRLLTLEEG
jgi:NADP-dependent 3-hydroxy-3-methylglutaryl-CoA reductase